MRVFVIDASHMALELQGGLIGVVGSLSPSTEEKKACVETVSRYAVDGWTISADPHTAIGRLAAMTAETACVPFVSFDRVIQQSEGPAIAPLLQALQSPVRGLR